MRFAFSSLAALALIPLSACMAPETGPTAAPEAAEAPASGQIELAGKSYGYRIVPAEPLSLAIPGSTDSQPALRVAGAESDTEASTVLAAVCGLDPAAAAAFGDYGDPVAVDLATGEWVYWLDCKA